MSVLPGCSAPVCSAPALLTTASPPRSCTDPAAGESAGHSRPLAAGWLAGLLLGLGLLCALSGPEQALAQSRPLAAELQCRLGSGPWRPCRMEVQDVGLNWVLRIGPERIAFRHSGDGAVTMQKGQGPWQPVTATWTPDTSLCWDGVCARGDIPLD